MKICPCLSSESANHDEPLEPSKRIMKGRGAEDVIAGGVSGQCETTVPLKHVAVEKANAACNAIAWCVRV
jgi:hypothetical protein